MSTVAREGSTSTFKPVSPGTHPAFCVQVVDLGTQRNHKFNKLQPKVLFAFEVTDEHDVNEETGEKNRKLVFARYTNSLHERSNLRAMLESWRSREFTKDELAGFDLRNVLGKPCLIGVKLSEDKQYANLASIMKCPPKMIEGEEPERTPIIFDVDNPDWTVFESFGDKLKDLIRSCEEWKSRGIDGNTTLGADDGPGSDPDDPGFGDDDIPF